jgi:hypothetical protein
MEPAVVLGQLSKDAEVWDSLLLVSLQQKIMTLSGPFQLGAMMKL